MTTRNKRKLAALNKENCEEHPRSNLAQNSAAPRSQEDYITQVSEEIEGRVTKKLSQQFSRTENRILGALARLDDFLMNPLLQGHFGNTPETSRNAFNTNQGTNEDDSQSDPHLEAGIFGSQRIQNSGQEICCDWFICPKRFPEFVFFNELERAFNRKLKCFLSRLSVAFSFYSHYCPSIPARHAANLYQPKRHPDAQEKLKHCILSTRL